MISVIPVGEVINGVRIIKRSDRKLNMNAKHESVFECQCQCGKTIYRLVTMIITGSVEMCDSCRARYRITTDNTKERKWIASGVMYIS